MAGATVAGDWFSFRGLVGVGKRNEEGVEVSVGVTVSLSAIDVPSELTVTGSRGMSAIW